MNSSGRIGIVSMPTYCNPISLSHSVCSSNYRTTIYFQQSHQPTSSSFNLQREMHKALATTIEENYMYPVSRSPTSYTAAGEGRGLELRELPHTHPIMFCIHLVIIIIRVLRCSAYSMPIPIFNVLQSHCILDAHLILCILSHFK